MCICTLATSGLQGGRVPQDKKAPSIHSVFTLGNDKSHYSSWNCLSLLPSPGPHSALTEWCKVKELSKAKPTERDRQRLGEEKREQDEKMKCSHRGSHERNLSENLWSHGSRIFPPITFVFLVKTHKPMQNSKELIIFFSSQEILALDQKWFSSVNL